MNAIAIALGLLCFALCLAPQALAQEPQIALSWSVPEGAQCPDLAYTERSLARMLGPPEPGRREVQAKVTVRRLGPGDWQLRLDTEQAGARGQRVLQDVSCQALADAAVVILAWMIDPEKMAAAGAAPSEPATSPRAPAPVAEPVPQRPPRAPLSAPSRALTPHVGAELGLDVGTLPRAAAGALGHFELEAYPVRWGVRGGYFPDVTRALAGSGSATNTELGGRFRLWNVGVQLCLEHRDWVATRVELRACVGPELDVLRGEAFGVSAPASGSKGWLAGLFELGARYDLEPHVAVGLSAAGIVPSIRENFAIHNLGVVHRPAAAALRVSAGLELAL